MDLVTATHYLTGIVPGLLLFVPALEIFFDLRPVNLDVGHLTWALFYSGFYVLQIVLAFFTLGSFRWEVLMLSSASFPIYAKALRNALIGADTKWSVTGAGQGRASAFNFIIPQVLTFAFLACASVVAIWRDLSMQQFNIATFWNIVNTIALGTFVGVALAEDRRRGQTDQERTEPLSETLSPGAQNPILDRSEIVAAKDQIRALADGAVDGIEAFPQPKTLQSAGADPYPTTGPLPVRSRVVTVPVPVEAGALHLPSPVRPEDEDFGDMPQPMRAAGWIDDPDPPTTARPAVTRPTNTPPSNTPPSNTPPTNTPPSNTPEETR